MGGDFYSSSGSYSKVYNTANESELKTQQAFQDTLYQKLILSTKVSKVLVMPTMLTSGNTSIINLRETAVRLQAKMLLVYNIKSDIYHRYKMFGGDEAKAFATVECFLMDTRTGLIPFTCIVTKESYKKKGAEDMSVDELRKNTEKEAVIKALSEIGDDVYEFLDGK